MPRYIVYFNQQWVQRSLWRVAGPRKSGNSRDDRSGLVHLRHGREKGDRTRVVFSVN